MAFASPAVLGKKRGAGCVSNLSKMLKAGDFGEASDACDEEYCAGRHQYHKMSKWPELNLRQAMGCRRGLLRRGKEWGIPHMSVAKG